MHEMSVCLLLYVAHSVSARVIAHSKRNNDQISVTNSDDNAKLPYIQHSFGGTSAHVIQAERLMADITPRWLMLH